MRFVLRTTVTLFSSGAPVVFHHLSRRFVLSLWPFLQISSCIVLRRPDPTLYGGWWSGFFGLACSHEFFLSLWVLCSSLWDWVGAWTMSKAAGGVGCGFAPPSSLGVAVSLSFCCVCPCCWCCCVGGFSILISFYFVFPYGLCCVSTVLGGHGQGPSCSSILSKLQQLLLVLCIRSS